MSDLAAPQIQRPRFNLRLWVVVVTLIAVILANAGLATVLSRYVASRIIQREGQQAQEFLNSILTAEDTADILARPEGAAALQSFAHHIRSLPGILRANVYGPDGRIVFSTEAGMVGTIPEDAEDLDQALNGAVSTSINLEIGDTVQAKTTGLFAPDGRVIEAYLPMTNAQGRVVAVVEFYRDAATLQQILHNITWIVWGAAGISGLAILAILFGGATRAARIITAQSDEMRSLSVMASLGQMATAVTHSLRNPLASIRSSVELLGLTQPEIAGPMVGEVVGEIDRIDRHIRDLLEFAGTESRGIELCLLAPLLDEAVERVRPAAARAGVEIRCDAGAGLRARLEPRLFLQMLDSLMTNAIEAMPAGGTITLTASRSGRRQVVLRLADTGPGFGPDLLAGAPRPFQTSKQRGLGLGLSITEKAMGRFGGRMRLSNARAGGAQIDLTFLA